MKYWLNLYTWNTWQEFIKAGGKVTGFRDRRWNTTQKIKKDDVFLCYMTGISRFFAIEEVTGIPYKDNTQIWGEALFSSRVPIEVVLALDPEYAVPVVSLRSELSIFQNLKSPYAWTGFFRGSPAEIKPDDAKVIIRALQEAQENPVFYEFDRRKLDRKVTRYETEEGVVSIPDDKEEIIEQLPSIIEDEVTHEEIQGLILHLGEQMGMDLWVANNDRGRFKSLSRLRSSLPVQFNEATNRTIELIDVLWLEDNRIVAAFEIEHTTSVYSGLLRMADLITMQPNINIPLFIVAPDERREKVVKEINRPIFSKALKQPLPEICRYIPYSILQKKIEQAKSGGFLRYLRPEFLDEIAEDVELDNS